MEKDQLSGAAEGERSTTGAAPEVKHWSANRKKEVVLGMMRSEPLDTLSRELGISEPDQIPGHGAKLCIRCRTTNQWCG